MAAFSVPYVCIRKLSILDTTSLCLFAGESSLIGEIARSLSSKLTISGKGVFGWLLTSVVRLIVALHYVWCCFILATSPCYSFPYFLHSARHSVLLGNFILSKYNQTMSCLRLLIVKHSSNSKCCLKNGIYSNKDIESKAIYQNHTHTYYMFK